MASTAKMITPVLLALIVVAAAQLTDDCSESGDGFCTRDLSSSSSGSPGGSAAFSTRTRGRSGPSGRRSSNVVSLSSSEERDIQAKLNNIKDAMPSFFSSFNTATDDSLIRSRPSTSRTALSLQQCSPLDGLVTLRQSSSSSPSSSFSSSSSSPFSSRRSRSSRRRIGSRRPIRPRHPSVQECREHCFTFTPRYVLHQGYWVPVVQEPWFTQTIRYCICTNPFCAGKSQCQWWWQGTCVPEKSYRKLLVVVRNHWGVLTLQWIKKRITVGCCCVPFGYGHHF